MLAFSVALLRLLLGLLLSSGPPAGHGVAPATESQYWIKSPGTTPRQWELAGVAHHTLLASADDHPSGFSSPWWVHGGEKLPPRANGWPLRVDAGGTSGPWGHRNGQRQRLRASIFPNAP